MTLALHCAYVTGGEMLRGTQMLVVLADHGTTDANSV